MDLEQLRVTVAPAYQDFHVRRLDALGSVARSESSERSDLDQLVEFHEPMESPVRQFFGLLHRREGTFDYKIGLLTSRDLRNPSGKGQG